MSSAGTLSPYGMHIIDFAATSVFSQSVYSLLSMQYKASRTGLRSKRLANTRIPAMALYHGPDPKFCHSLNVPN